MPTMQRNSKGHFMKRSKGGGGKRRKSVAMTVQPTRTVYRNRAAKKTARRRGGKRGGGINLLHVGAAALGLAYLTGDNGPAMLRTAAAKIPGTKTFGAAATLGLGCLAVDKFVKPNKWLKLAGLAGVVLAATQVGKAGTAFKWVGDVEDVADVDISDVEDVSDVEGDGYDD